MYIFHDNNTISGIGRTAQEAALYASGNWDADSGTAQKCTKSLYKLVLEKGGCISWGEIDGVACTDMEEELSE